MEGTKFNYYEDLDRSQKLRISKIERDIQNGIINLKKDFFEIGKLLDEAKRILPHGSFMSWIKTTFADDLPYTTAYFYMRVYRTFKNRTRMLNCLSMKDLLLMTRNDFPEDALTIMDEHVEENGSIDRRQLDEIRNFHDLMMEGTVGGNQFLKEVEKTVKDRRKLDEDSFMNQNKHRMNINARRTMYFGIGDILEKLNSAIKSAREMAWLIPFDPNDPEHKKVIKFIQKIIEKLQELERELCGGEGLFKPTSTEDGTKYL
ncbi:DUF3102 domain-containing protein [Rhodohalobacter mucosus]|uniref:DUF3102 domain-containing protein n=1 Tax=Rhodohalobacter mucosus TaxID=2079485 RepID=A0A316TTN3_9BACT|nr:DUF3102 domain-containing protein [Rhodohalobacter mucosus]PWN05644.1 hypothetical protein DDZ15_13685 [Rhodohalobacter mucosus]